MSPWTPNERTRLRAMYDEGVQIKVIAKAFGRTPQALYFQLHKMGLKDRRFPRSAKLQSIQVFLPPEELAALRVAAKAKHRTASMHLRKLIEAGIQVEG